MSREDPAVSGAVSPAASGAVSVASEELAGAREHTREEAGQAASRGAVDKSRLPKGSSALRSPARRSVGELRLSLARRLTDRDREIVRALGRYRVLTTDQLAEMFFDTRRRAQVRLVRLHEIGVLDRFEPHRSSWGRRPYHYVLGPLGAAVLAAERDEDPDRAARRWRSERTLALGRTQRLAHILGVNDFAAALVAQGRRSRTTRLLDWLTEAEAARWTDGIVRPDGWGVWDEEGSAVEFFLEYDRGTETLARLAAKLRDYERFETERGATAWVLFAFTSPRREARARAALQAATVPVATAVLSPPALPSDQVWAPVSPDSSRVRLAVLAALPKPPEALRRAERNSARAWRFDRSRPDDDEEAPIETP